MTQPHRDDNHAHYEAVTDRNRERLGVLHSLGVCCVFAHPLGRQLQSHETLCIVAAEPA